MAQVRDPEGVEARALLAMADFVGKRVLEVGAGEGRLTWSYAPLAASVYGVDPEEERIEQARAATPADLADRVAFDVAKAEELEVEPASFDLAFFSWSL